ncbi:MAG: hypothetical protein C4562_06410 [Actinobacteria bacterium]|nr:MAG: hypothetical protein C4562_06410 [Actinomycetota bacterium]
MDIKETTISLTKEIRGAVFPHIGKISSRRVTGIADGGDSTFAIDEIAETVTSTFFKDYSDIAYYTEDQGFKVKGSPKWLFIIDPIDGTRPAAAGLESCCVSVALAPYSKQAKMKDVTVGAVQEIKSGTLFVAQKDKGVEIINNSFKKNEPVISHNQDISKLFWTIGFRGRPADVLVTVLGGLIDISSVDGGLFDIGSACFSSTRLITGQMDAYIDIGKRCLDEVPATKELFKKVGHGHILNNNPYDIAAAALIMQEAGMVVTDAEGLSLDEYLLIGSGPKYQFSVVAATGKELHLKVLKEINKGIKKLKERY